MNNYAKWFQRLVYIGVLINILGMALPFIFAAQFMIDWLGLPGGGGSVIWMRQAGLLLFYISILYLPGGRDPLRFSLNAKFAVLVRLTIGLYWFYLVLVEGRTYSFLIFGFLDVPMALLQGFLLWQIFKKKE
jgi:hypothetical protein